jgi:hypothetical protein
MRSGFGPLMVASDSALMSKSAPDLSTFAARLSLLKVGRIPAVAAFALLAFQVAIPWTVPHLLTQDGPSHVYTATVARTMLFDHHSVYRPFYKFNGRLVPNWGSTLLIGAVGAVSGAAHAEQALMSLSILAGFFAFAYAIKAIDPDAVRWTPIANFVLQVWYPWIGFYNFYLGMVLCPILIGFYVRRIHRLTFRAALAIAGGLVALFFTHVIPAILTVLTLASCAIWVHLIVPLWRRDANVLRTAARHLIWIGVALAPTVALCGVFALSSKEPVIFTISVRQAWEHFPDYVFSTAAGRMGAQNLLWPAVLFYIVAGTFSMRRKEWFSARGGLAVAALLAFLIYLFVPDDGFGGGGAKMRFSWGFFLIGSLLASSCRAIRYVASGCAIYVFAMLLPNLIVTTQTLSDTGKAVEEYLSATTVIPRGSRFIRIGFPIPSVPKRYGLEGIGREPLLHADAFVAARCVCVDLSDYQAASKVFPVDFKPAITETLRYNLWGLERQLPGNTMGQMLPWLRDSLPAPVDYVILVGDESAAGDPEFGKVLANLNAGMRLASSSQFVRVYQRTGLR